MTHWGMEVQNDYTCKDVLRQRVRSYQIRWLLITYLKCSGLVFFHESTRAFNKEAV
jgi:hypothetical protein